MTITTPIVVSTIGQEIVGPDLIEQTTEGSNGINFRTGTDDLLPGGAGTYLNGVRRIKLNAANANTGTGLSVGDPSAATHAGDYFHGERLFLTGFQTAIHFNSMAMGWLRDVLITHSPEARGDIGIRVTGGSSNSHLWQGVTIGNVGIAVSWETPGMGNVIMPGDVGSATIGFDIYTGAQITVIGGNTEATISGKVFNVRTDARLMTIGIGGQGLRTTPAFDLNGGYGRLIHVNTAIGRDSGVTLVTGAGYGNSIGIESGIQVDAEESPTGQRWKDQAEPAYLSTAIPTPSADFRMAKILCVKNHPDHRDGTLQCVQNPFSDEWAWEWLNSGDFL